MRQDSDCVNNSGATYHANTRGDVSVTYHIGDFGAVKMENKNVSEITSVRDVHFETDTGWQLSS